MRVDADLDVEPDLVLALQSFGMVVPRKSGWCRFRKACREGCERYASNERDRAGSSCELVLHHVSPEAAHVDPSVLIRDGDIIVINVGERKI